MDKKTVFFFIFFINNIIIQASQISQNAVGRSEVLRDIALLRISSGLVQDQELDQFVDEKLITQTRNQEDNGQFNQPIPKIVKDILSDRSDIFSKEEKARIKVLMPSDQQLKINSRD